MQTATPRLVSGREVTPTCSPRMFMDRRRIELPARCLQGSVATLVHAGPRFLVEPTGNDPASPACEAGALPIELRPHKEQLAVKGGFINSEVPSTSSSRMLLRAIGKQRLARGFHRVGVRPPGLRSNAANQPSNIMQAITAKAMSIWEESNLLLRLATACYHKHLTLSPSAFAAGEGSTDPPFR